MLIYNMFLNVRKFTATQVSYMAPRIGKIVTLCYSTFRSDLKWYKHCATTTELQKSYKLNIHHFFKHIVKFK